MSVQFEDNSIQVKRAMDQALVAALHEVAGEVVSRTQRDSTVGKVGGGQTKGSWRYTLNESKLEATIGNPLENAIWEEFGTGEYALEGKGRKGGWYIPIGNGSGEISEAVVDAYHMKVVYGEDGKKFAHTKGKPPKRTFRNTYESMKAAIIRRFEQALKGLSE